MAYTIYDVREKVETEGDLLLQTCSSLIRASLTSTMPVPWDMLESINSGESTPITEIAQYELPVLIPAAIGILVALVVLIVTPLFCCCRCCGCCGARLLLSDVRKQRRCCLYVTSTFVMFSILLISLTAFSSYESGVRFRKSPRLILEMVDSSLDDLPAFITNFGREMSLLVETELNKTLKDMKVTVEDLPNILSAPLTNIAGSAMTGVNSHIQALQNGIANITHLETETNSTVEDIIQHSQNLENGISVINNNLTLIKNKCVTDGENFCDLLLDPSRNTTDFNVTELSDLSSSVTDLVSELNGVNLTEIKNLGSESLSKLPEVIDNSSVTAVSGVLEELDKIPGTVLPELDKMLEFTNLSRSTLGLDSSVDSLRDLVDSYDALTSPLIDKTVLPSVSSYMSFIGLIALLGLLLGLLCSSRGKTISARSKPSHIGATCLICTVTLSVLPVIIFMLMSPLLLVVGSNLSIICGPLQDLTLIGKIENGYLDLFSIDDLRDTLNVNISIRQFFETCRNKGTVFSGLQLGDTFNLSSYINVSSFVPKLGSDVYDEINETIRDMNVLDVALIDNMTSSFTFANITSDNATHSIKQELRDLDLVEWSTNLTTVVQQIPKQSYANAYKDLAQLLINLDVNEKIPLLLAMENIDNITFQLEDLADKLQNSSESIANELENLQQFIQNQATDSVFTAIEGFLDDMAQVPVDFIDAVTHKMSDDVGQCGVLWDIYDGVTSSFCNYLLDSLTVFWFSLYVGGLAMVVLMISSCRIGKYFRKPNDILGQTTYHNNSSKAPSTNDDSPVIKRKRVNASNNNNTETWRTLPNWWYCRVIQRKQQKRRRHCLTGSQSPRLTKIRLLRESLRNTTVFGNENAQGDFNKDNASVNESTPLIKTDLFNVNEMTEYTSVMCTPQMNHKHQGSKVEEFDMDVQSPCLHFYTDHSTEVFDYSKLNKGFNSSADDVKLLNNMYENKVADEDVTELQSVGNVPVDGIDKDSDTIYGSSMDRTDDREKGHVVHSKQNECEIYILSELGNQRKVPNGNKGGKEKEGKVCMDSSKSTLQDRIISIDGLTSFVEPSETKLLDEKSCDTHSLQSQKCSLSTGDRETNINRITENNLGLYQDNEFRGVKIQCALCKSRNLTESGDVFGLPSENGPEALNGHHFHESENTLGKEGGASEVFMDCLTDTNIHVKTYERTTSKTNPRSQYKLLASCTDCNDNLHGVYAEAIPENNAMSNANTGPLNEVLCKFNFVYESIASSQEGIEGHTISNNEEKNINSKQFNREVSTRFSGTKTKTSNKNVLCIQVKPYKDLYADQDYMGTKSIKQKCFENLRLPPNSLDTTKRGCDTISETGKCLSESIAKKYHSSKMLDGFEKKKYFPKPMADTQNGRDTTFKGREYPQEVNRKRKLNTPVVSLSMLAGDAVTQANNRSILTNEFRHMTASCGHDVEKTTYL